ncbi:hypothetical protein OS189_04095 [Sulfitobacter sp. F26169L]|uniref:hypothetical protein n=1 Tax=Sulfitobacter sp. F26169L TaxID=2996015 RepID=UPI0022609954|nr:hypothetical protein [Sulfitobacter sp. F26169L]MCX7565524.1 hypothetical protein [Sulfitobacter sp. F26169L]
MRVLMWCSVVLGRQVKGLTGLGVGHLFTQQTHYRGQLSQFPNEIGIALQMPDLVVTRT